MNQPAPAQPGTLGLRPHQGALMMKEHLVVPPPLCNLPVMAHPHESSWLVQQENHLPSAFVPPPHDASLWIPPLAFWWVPNASCPHQSFPIQLQSSLCMSKNAADVPNHVEQLCTHHIQAYSRTAAAQCLFGYKSLLGHIPSSSSLWPQRAVMVDPQRPPADLFHLQRPTSSRLLLAVSTAKATQSCDSTHPPPISHHLASSWWTKPSPRRLQCRPISMHCLLELQGKCPFQTWAPTSIPPSRPSAVGTKCTHRTQGPANARASELNARRAFFHQLLWHTGSMWHRHSQQAKAGSHAWGQSQRHIWPAVRFSMFWLGSPSSQWSPQSNHSRHSHPLWHSLLTSLGTSPGRHHAKPQVPSLYRSSKHQTALPKPWWPCWALPSCTDEWGPCLAVSRKSTFGKSPQLPQGLAGCHLPSCQDRSNPWQSLASCPPVWCRHLQDEH